jgi:hypothetical protein
VTDSTSRGPHSSGDKNSGDFDALVSGTSSEPERHYFDDAALSLEKGEDFLKDPTDFTDRAGSRQRRNRGITIAAVVIILSALAAGGYLFSQLLTASQEERVTPVATSEPTDMPAADPEATPTGIFTEAFPNGITVESGEVLVTRQSDTAFSSSSGHRLDVVTATLTPAGDTCKVTIPTDFCYAGAGEAAGTAFDVYFFKDMVNSRIFTNPNALQPFELAGAASANKVFVNFVGGQETAGVALAFTDGSGYFIKAADAAAVEALTPLLSTL